jgi:histidinol-phosphate aminotransferase
MKPVSIQHLVPPWLASLVPYQPGKPIEEVEREYGIRESIKLASNENPLGPSPRAVAALRAAIGEELARHPLVASFELAGPDEGGDGATIATLR